MKYSKLIKSLKIVLSEAEKSYILYVKWPGQKKFSPVDWREGKQVVNLIHATMFSENEMKEVDAELTKLKKDNKGMDWEFRPTK